MVPAWQRVRHIAETFLLFPSGDPAGHIYKILMGGWCCPIERVECSGGSFHQTYLHECYCIHGCVKGYGYRDTSVSGIDPYFASAIVNSSGRIGSVSIPDPVNSRRNNSCCPVDSYFRWNPDPLLDSP